MAVTMEEKYEQALADAARVLDEEETVGGKDKEAAVLLSSSESVSSALSVEQEAVEVAKQLLAEQEQEQQQQQQGGIGRSSTGTSPLSYVPSEALEEIKRLVSMALQNGSRMAWGGLASILLLLLCVV
jgi:hypothetical protein